MVALQENPWVPQPTEVLSLRRETRDTFTLVLSAPSEDYRFAPGQFNMLYAFGVGEVPISISGDPSNPQRVVHTVRAVGAVTSALTKRRKGEVLGFRGPFGSSWPLESAQGKNVLMIAGGIGLAPLRPAIYQILRYRRNYQRFWLLYGARTPQDLLYTFELAKWSSRLDTDVLVTVDAGDEQWRGNVGVVTRLLRQVEFDPENTVAMICGPEIMMRFAVREIRSRGIPEEAIYLSMERNMKCALGFCGHCQFGPTFICKEGPVFSYAYIRPFFETREI